MKTASSHFTIDESLEPFLNPDGIAVIGASHNPNKLGYGLARNLIQSNYPGAAHFVNPKGGTLLGHPVYTSIAQIPDPVDLAVLLIPAQFIPQAIRECGERGIHAIIIGSGGFRETGAAGANLERECYEIARTYHIRLLGPNCIGILDTHLPMDVTFLPPPGPVPGDVAFISHSGAICAAVIDWARGQGFGLSRLVSLGNQVDVNETDMLAPVAADPYTHVLTLYLEGVNNGRRFIEEASRVTRKKPIIALKVGRYASGQRAVASHTGALAGQENAYNAAFRRAGVIRANTSEELFDWARALAWCPLPQGRNVAVLTNAGGPGVTAADALEANGMHLADLRQETITELKKILPPAASVKNPVDMLASASPEQYANSLKILLNDADVHAVMVIMPPPPMYSAGGLAKAIIPIINSADKPVIVALMGERLIQEAVEHFRAVRIPEYRFPERAASALAVLAQRSEYLQRIELQNKTICTPEKEKAKAIIDNYLDSIKTAGKTDSAQKSIFLPANTANQLLAAYKIPAFSMSLAKSPEEAVKAAEALGYPVVLKIASPDIPHKSDIGGVLLNLTNASAVNHGFSKIVQNAGKHAPDAQIQGVHVQKMVPGGQEVIIGAVQDPQFGPLLMFGSGGVEVEGLKDIAFALAPLTDDETAYLLESTWAGQKLDGFRNIPPADKEAVKKVLVCLSQLVSDVPEIEEIDLNPLRVLSPGQGVAAIDIRIKLKLE